MDDQPFESVMVLLRVGRAALRGWGVLLDPFADVFPRCRLVGIRIITSQKIYLKIGRLAQAWNLMSSLFLFVRCPEDFIRGPSGRTLSGR